MVPGINSHAHYGVQRPSAAPPIVLQSLPRKRTDAETLCKEVDRAIGCWKSGVDYR